MAVHFAFETPFHLKDRRKLKKWIQDTIKQHGKQMGDITYVFCNDEYLLSINQEYLQHDYYTDIITFDYVEKDVISGDLFISVERIRDNAVQNQWNFEEEILRVIIHGVLHLLGHEDLTETDEKEMRQAEEQALQSYHILDK